LIYQDSRKTRCRTVAWFCHPPQRKRNTKSKRHSYKNNACSQHGVTWHTDAIGFHNCDLGLLSHLLSLRQLQQKQSRNLPIHLILNVFCLYCVCLWVDLLFVFV
jgi:hypothetical protein